MAKPARPAMDQVIPQVRSVAESIATPLGARVVDVQFVREEGRPTLRVIVAEEGDTHVEVCARVSKAVSKALDELEHLLPDTYFLEVASPGVVVNEVPPLDDDEPAAPAPERPTKRPAKGKKSTSRPGPGEEELS